MLVNRGPLPASDFDGGLSSYIKQDGATTFKVSTKNETSVVYIDGKHSPKAVVQTWVDLNQSEVDRLGKWATFSRIRRHGSEWANVARDVLGPFDRNHGGGEHTAGGTCPICGDEYTNNLPDHLPCDG